MFGRYVFLIKMFSVTVELCVSCYLEDQASTLSSRLSEEVPKYFLNHHTIIQMFQFCTFLGLHDFMSAVDFL